MPDGDFTEHFVEQVVEIGATTECLQVWRIFLFGRRNVQSVMIRIVEEVALDAPNFVVHLVPLDTRVDVNFHCIGVELSFAGFGRRGGCRDEPRRALPVQYFLAVRGYLESEGGGNERLGLASAEIEFADRERGRP